MKLTPEQIRQRFDTDVERFANLKTGQTATIDAPLVLELISQAAAAVTPRAASVLDIGCGAGNYTLKLLGVLPDLDVTLIDLSQPMLARACERIRPVTRGTVAAVQGDVRGIDLGRERFDVILAAMVLHHLREDAEWQDVFARCHQALRPGGSIWIADLVWHDDPAVQQLLWRRYGDYLVGLRGQAYRDQVFTYIDREDTPRSLLFQVDLLCRVGFRKVEILHKNSCFAAFGALK
ncbi:MAG TPA: class I SAM-dependent methyltransferase [Gemmataceae bacterium]|nr:class I SAM-dependent methyltransferase [Gemmataceae bacterium]